MGNHLPVNHRATVDPQEFFSGQSAFDNAHSSRYQHFCAIQKKNSGVIDVGFEQLDAFGPDLTSASKINCFHVFWVVY